MNQLLVISLDVLSTIGSINAHSELVVVNCLQFLDKIAFDDDQLLGITKHSQGLQCFLDIIPGLNISSASTVLISLQFVLEILRNPNVMYVLFQQIDKNEFIKLFEKKLKLIVTNYIQRLSGTNNHLNNNNYNSSGIKLNLSPTAEIPRKTKEVIANLNLLRDEIVEHLKVLARTNFESFSAKKIPTDTNIVTGFFKFFFK
jgi:hypothetical protein